MKRHPKKLPPPVVDIQPKTPAPLWEVPVIQPPLEGDWNGIFESARTFYRRKGTLLFFAVLGIATAALVSQLQSPMYESSASVEIEGANENFLNLRDVDPVAPSHYSPEYVETEAEILRQDIFVKRAAQDMKLAGRVEAPARPGRLNDLLKLAGWKRPADAPKPTQAPEALTKRLKIKSNRDSRIIQIVFDSPDPQFAADFANTMAQELIEQSIESRRQAAQQTQEWLGPQLHALRTRVEESEAELDAYARNNGLVFTEGQQNLAQSKLKLLQDELSKAQADSIARKSQSELVATKLPETLVDDPAIREYDAKIADLRRQAADLGAILTPENVKVKRLKAQITELLSAREQQAARIRQRLENESSAATSRERDLHSVYSEQSALVSSLADKITRYNTLKHEVDMNRQFYESMQQKVNEAGVASAVRHSNIRLVGPAEPARSPYTPNLPLNVGVGLFASLAIGVGFVLLKEQSDRRVRAPGETSLYVNLPELGAIRKFDASMFQRLKGGHGAVERITWEKRTSPWSDSFRGAVASILAARGKDRPRVLLVTSSLPREGKTTVSCNLAIALAEVSQRVLLIDGDVRRPRLRGIFDLDDEAGLSDLLEQDAGSGNAPIGTKTSIPHLHVLSSGPLSDNFFGLLLSERLERMIQRCREEFDYVVVDAPPCLDFADARLMGRLADAALLVVRANVADGRTAMAAAQKLMFDGVPVLGTILNDWDPAASGAYSGYGYGYGYGYAPHGYLDAR